jgi:four helix bundle protein
MSTEGLQKLEAWRKSMDFSVKVYREVIPLLPPEEKWSLGQQLRRSAQSIPANVAEGYGRYYYQDNVRFCYMARGSLEETLSHLILVYELKLIPESIFYELSQQGDDLTRLINGYIAYLKRSKQGSNEPGANHLVHDQPELYHAEFPEDDS